MPDGRVKAVAFCTGNKHCTAGHVWDFEQLFQQLMAICPTCGPEAWEGVAQLPLLTPVSLCLRIVPPDCLL